MKMNKENYQAVSLLQPFFDTLEPLIKDWTRSVIAEVMSSQSSQADSDDSGESFLTRKQTAKYLQVSLPTLSRYTKLGILLGYKFGSSVRYKKKDVENSLKVIASRKYQRL